MALHKKLDTTCFSSVESQILARSRHQMSQEIPPALAVWSFNFPLQTNEETPSYSEKLKLHAAKAGGI
jgi:hypothetical protein